MVYLRSKSEREIKDTHRFRHVDLIDGCQFAGKVHQSESVRPSDILSTTIVVDRFRRSIDWGRVLSSFFPIGWKKRIEIILLVHGKLMTKIKDTHRFRRTDCIGQRTTTRAYVALRRLSRGNSGHPKFPHQLFLGSRTGQTHSIKIGAIQVLKTRIYRCWSRSKACVPEIMGVLIASPKLPHGCPKLPPMVCRACFVCSRDVFCGRRPPL